MHAMQEDGSHDHGPSANGMTTDPGSGTSGSKKQHGPTMRDTIATVVGMLVPLLAQMGGHHHH